MWLLALHSFDPMAASAFDAQAVLIGTLGAAALISARSTSSPPSAAEWDIDWEAEASRADWLAATCSQPLNESSFAVRPAGRKGLGLFATEPIERGVYLFDYQGVIIKEEDFVGSDYAVGINNAAGIKYLVDGADPNSGFGRYLNHAVRDPTCVLVREAYNPHSVGCDDPPPRLHILTARDVAEGEELVFDYGEEYWRGRSELRRRERRLRELEALAEAQQRAAGEVQSEEYD